MRVLAEELADGSFDDSLVDALEEPLPAKEELLERETPPEVVAFSAVVLLNEKNEILLDERADDGMLDIPGGSIELGESTEDAAKREVKEETGLAVTDLALFHVYSGELGHYVYPNGDEVYGVDIVYLSPIKQAPMQRQAEEVRALKWHALEAVPL